MKTLIILLLTGINFLPFHVSQENGTITVTVNNFENDKGHAVLSIFEDKEGFPMDIPKAYKSLEMSISDGSATFTVTDLPTGTYALAVIHDENRNGKLDTNFIGIPKEGACASNNAKGRFGPPKFKNASFTLSEAGSKMELKMIYFSNNELLRDRP